MNYTAIYTIVILLSSFTLTISVLRFTNIKCEHFEPSFAMFQKCQLKLIKRGVVGLSVYCKVFKLPVNNITINLSMYRKSNLNNMYSPYNSFLYNISADFCAFMKNRNKFPFLNIFMDNLADVSNVNHPCPYNHDVNVSQMILKENMFKYVPLPAGDYIFKVKLAVYNHWKAEIKAYTTVELKKSKN